MALNLNACRNMYGLRDNGGEVVVGICHIRQGLAVLYQPSRLWKGASTPIRFIISNHMGRKQHCSSNNNNPNGDLSLAAGRGSDWQASCAILAGQVLENGKGNNGVGVGLVPVEKLPNGDLNTIISQNMAAMPRPLSITDLAPPPMHGSQLRVAYQGVQGHTVRQLQARLIHAVSPSHVISLRLPFRLWSSGLLTGQSSLWRTPWEGASTGTMICFLDTHFILLGRFSFQCTTASLHCQV